MYLGSAERALEGLVDVGVGDRVQGFGPGGCERAALGGGAGAAVPADLLHVAVELDAVAVRVERKGAVVDAGVELGRQVNEGAALRLQEIGGRAQLRVVRQFDAERQAGRVRAEAERAAQ